MSTTYGPERVVNKESKPFQSWMLIPAFLVGVPVLGYGIDVLLHLDNPSDATWDFKLAHGPYGISEYAAIGGPLAAAIWTVLELKGFGFSYVSRSSKSVRTKTTVIEEPVRNIPAKSGFEWNK